MITSAEIDNQFNTLVRGPLQILERWEQELFRIRLELHLKDVIRPLSLLYGDRADFDACIINLLDVAAQHYADRPVDLRRLDISRVHNPDWFQQADMVGYVCYADRFAGSLSAIRDHIPYLKELGVTYLHVMPLLQPRPGPNDGGYAVMDYRCVDSRLGAMEDLVELSTALRSNGISLCTDLVCNHTAKEHRWAQAALAGDPYYLDYYISYPDRSMPDEWEKTLPEVFPDFAPGNFTYYDENKRWVWTTFNEYQWDLNYRNPAVFREMLSVILFLANRGVEVIRLDAVAFMWKRLGTDSQNQPEAHAVLQAWRALTRLAAPGVLLLAEAIVSPDKLIPYLGVGEATNKECDLAYHNVYMVLLWSALAERNVRLLTYALQQMPSIPSGAAWLSYVRCHDDIGWAVRDEDAGAIGLNGFLHRAFLSDFYSGHFPGSFARGATFQYNERTKDRRISGSLASLAGLELALENGDPQQINLAIGRILLLHGLIMAFGGIPLLYMGDEIGLLNDPSYLNNPLLADDNRWLHRPQMDWGAAVRHDDVQTVAGRIFAGVKAQVHARKSLSALHAEAETLAVWTHNDHVFGLLRNSPRGRLLILANFTELEQTVPAYRFAEMSFGDRLVDRLTGRKLDGRQDVRLATYEIVWLQSAAQG